jgi:phosphate transport system permease protein
MSIAYARETALVNAQSTGYEQVLDGVIALSIFGFTTALLTLVGAVSLTATGSSLGTFFGAMLAVVAGGIGVVGAASRANVVSIGSQRVRGIGIGSLVVTVLLTAVGFTAPLNLATLLGGVLVVQAVVVAGTGVASRLEVVDTAPDASAGLLAGGSFGIVGLFVGLVVFASIVGFGPGALAGGAVVGLGLGAITVLPREDLGSTLPVSLLVGTLGVVIATAAIGVGWQWNPGAIEGAFTGGVVIPLFTVFGALVSGWAAAKARAGFGATGREYGAFLLVYLNGVMMTVVMVSIVAFVLSRGIAYATHGFSIGALSLLVLLTPVFAAVTEFARTRPGSNSWHQGVRELFRVVPLAATGAVAALLTTVLLTGERAEYQFTYTVLTSDRESETLDTALAVTPEPTVSGFLLLVPAVVLAVALFRRYGSLRNVGKEFPRVETVRKAVPAAVAGVVVLTVVFGILGPTPAGLPLGGTLGAGVVTAGAVGAALLASLPLAGVVGQDGPLPDRVQSCAPLFTVGVFGALGVLTAVLLLQPAAGTTPALGPAGVVSTAASLAAALLLVAAAIAAYANRSTTDTLRGRLLGEETVLGLCGTAGFTALLGLHVLITGASVRLVVVSVTPGGTVSWPMIMQAYIPLGLEPGGIMPAVVGTIWLVIGATLFAVPLGLGAAVFLTEYAEQGLATAVVEIATNALWSTPSIVFGLFGAAFIIPRVGGDESLLAGMFVLGFMLLPLVLITSRESIKSVPDEYRDASAALGVSRWQTIRSVVLPAALPGVITGIILGVGRIAGETAPLILVLGSTLNAGSAVNVLEGFRFVSRPPFVVNDQLLASSAALPTQVWGVISAGVSGSAEMGWASASILLMVVLSFYVVGISARTYFRRKLNYE